ncbi:MAG: hypothetical protein IIA89_02070 [Chloroflexi bacterium]|nr:hypothetical protein [Chloroflexota bacterium]
MSEPQTVAQVLAVLAAAYPRFKLPVETIRVYEQTLGDIPVEALRAATLDLIAESEWFPTVAKIRKRSFALMASENESMSAYEAWALTLDFIRDGRGHPIISKGREFDVPPVIEQTVRQVGGWKHLAEAENAAADRARFLEAFERTTEKGEYLARQLPQIADLAQRLSLPVTQEFAELEDK